VKRVALGLLGAGLAAAGLLAAGVLAGTPHVLAGSTDSTASSATATTETSAPAATSPPAATSATVSTPSSTVTAPAKTTTPTTPPVTRPKRVVPRLATGVTIGGVHVGGLGADAAYQVVRASFDTPLVLVARGRRISVLPSDLGAVAYVKAAVADARRSGAHASLALRVRVDGGRVRAYVAALAGELERKAVDSSVVLRGLSPAVSKGSAGWQLDRRAAARSLIAALQANRRAVIRLPLREVQPKLKTTNFPVIVIRRDTNQLLLYAGAKVRHVFHVATGQSAYPTPLGRFQIVVKWENPWWYPPNSPWAKGAKPIPPGPGNPLGTRWMGLSAPGVGIHGTPDAASIGYSLSHGCIRMLIPDAEWLFNQVEIGTPVFIVAA